MSGITYIAIKTRLQIITKKQRNKQKQKTKTKQSKKKPTIK
jgi:hypothetical protein